MQLLNFTGKDAIREFYSDQAEELDKASKELGWMHTESEAYISKANTLIERRNQEVLHHGRCNLNQAGWPASWWKWGASYAAGAKTIWEELRRPDPFL